MKKNMGNKSIFDCSFAPNIGNIYGLIYKTIINKNLSIITDNNYYWIDFIVNLVVPYHIELCEMCCYFLILTSKLDSFKVKENNFSTKFYPFHRYHYYPELSPFYFKEFFEYDEYLPLFISDVYKSQYYEKMLKGDDDFLEAIKNNKF